MQQKWKKSEKSFKSYRVNKSLRPAAARGAAQAAVGAPAPAHEPVQKHKVTPSILGWLKNGQSDPKENLSLKLYSQLECFIQEIYISYCLQWQCVEVWRL